MKYDLTKKPTRGAIRTLSSFSSTMLLLLTKKTFEEITVNELCSLSNFPRATFYNYFDDKYDLINYCWHDLAAQIHLEEIPLIDDHHLLNTFFDRLYFLFKEKQDLLNGVLKYNDYDSFLIGSFVSYMRKVMHALFKEQLETCNNKIPIEIISDHYSNTILLMLEWVFIQKKTEDLDSIHAYLDYLLKDI